MNTDNLIIKHNELTAEEFIELWNSVWSGTQQGGWINRFAYSVIIPYV